MFAAQSGERSDPFMETLRKPPVKGATPRSQPTQQQPSSFQLSRVDPDQDTESVYSARQDARSTYTAYNNTSGGGAAALAAISEQYALKYPPLPDKDREKLVEQYHAAKYPFMTPEQVEAEEVEKIKSNNLALEIQVQMKEYSTHFMDVKRTAFVPQHCTNLHFNGLHAEVGFSLPGPPHVDFAPRDPLTCYGSIFDWGQGGADIPPAPKPHGDLANVYLLRYFFTYFRNTSPVSVGVLLGEKKKGEFKKLERRTYYTDGGDPKESTYHFILPPFSESTKETDLYRSSAHVNNSYGKEYPFLTSERANILHRCVPVGTNGKGGWFVPLRHPIANWCIHEGNFPEEEMPKQSLDNQADGEFFYIVPRKTVDIAVAELTKKASLYIPVTDMEALCLRFVPLVNMPLSSDLFFRDGLERESEIQQGKWAFNLDNMSKLDHEKKTKRKELKERYGITFTAEFFIMFRKWAAEAVSETENDVISEEGENDD